MSRGYSSRRSYDRNGGSNQFFAGLAALASLYPFYCLIIWILKLTTPDKIDFINDTQISNSLNKSLANWLYSNTIDAKVLVVCFIVIVACVYIHKKL